MIDLCDFYHDNHRIYKYVSYMYKKYYSYDSIIYIILMVDH